MDMNVIITLVETHSHQLAQKWLERLRKEEGMEEYLIHPDHDLHSHVEQAFQEIGLYLDQPRHHVITGHFRHTGRLRRKEGVPLVRVIRAIQLARSTLWQFLLEQGLFDSTVNSYLALNLYRQIVQLFDSAVLHTIEGYFEEQ
jgi:hypothetical protein